MSPNEAPKNAGNAPPAGVPLGGVGTGCIELGKDALFRNITINNNRDAASRIPVAPGAFFAVRAKCGSKTWARILQRKVSVPFESAGAKPQFTAKTELAWQGLYPVSRYQLRTDDFPIAVNWTANATVIPYDIEASTLPAVLFAFDFENTTDEHYGISCMFNWENIRGCVGTNWPAARGAIRMVGLAEDYEFAAVVEPADRTFRPNSPIGLAFGYEEAVTTNADGNYAVLAGGDGQTRVTTTSWNSKDAGDVRALWDSFETFGSFRESRTSDPNPNCGSVCCASELPPRGTRRFYFVLTWYCPKYEVGGTDQGNGYCNDHSDAIGVGLYTLKHAEYFLKSIADWQGRFLRSSLPSWYAQAVVNNCHVFSTNTIITKNGDFSMMETPEDPAVGALDRSFYTSLATLLFFPSLAEKELEQFAKTQDRDEPGRLYRDLGRGCLHDPSYGASARGYSDAARADEKTDILAKFVLMVYRNYRMTGRLPALRHIYPQLKSVMEYALYKDTDRDGVPNGSGSATMFDGCAVYGLNVYTAGLWIAAAIAYARLARELKDPEEADYYENVARTAIQHFERRLWHEEGGYYRLYHDAAKDTGDHAAFHDGCLSAQLAGPWFAYFLRLRFAEEDMEKGAVFLPDRLRRALETVDRLTTRPRGIALAADAQGRPWQNPPSVADPADTERYWPGLTLGYLVCPHFYYGNPARGFEILHGYYGNVHGKRQRVYDQPLGWDTTTNAAAGWGADRHMGPLAIWHSLFAIQGFFFDVPERKLYIEPNLPTETNILSCPVMTPSCLGWLNYEITEDGGYRQRVRVSFDSPVHIERIELHVPKRVNRVAVHLLTDGDVGEAMQHTFPGDTVNVVRISLRNAILIQDSVQIQLRQRSDVAAPT